MCIRDSSGSQFLDAVDNPFFTSNDTQGAGGLITFGGLGAPSKLQGLNIQLVGNITASGDISASGTISAYRFQSATGGTAIDFNDDLIVSGDITATSGSFQYITSSVIDVNADTIRIGGTSFSKTELDNLKGGKSISTNTDKQVVHQNDDSTFVQMLSLIHI